MPTRSFAITADEKPLVLKSDGAGEIAVNVSNTTARPIRGLAKVVPLGSTRQEWLSITGEIERNFPANGAQQFIVKVAAPAATPPGRYSCRLNVMSAQNPDDDFTEGPVLNFEVSTTPPPEPQKGFPKWLLWVLLGLVAIGGVVAAALVLARGGKSHLHADFNQSVGEGYAPLTVRFTNLTVGEYQGLLWNFGDGATATNEHPEHVFTKPGTCVITLLVAGKKDQSFATNVVVVAQRAQAQFEASPDSGPAPLTVKLANLSTGDGLSWNWDFGNGKTSTDRDPPPQTYPTPGNYTIRLVATGPVAGGASNISAKVVLVRALPPSRVDFSAAPTAGEVPLTVKFADRSVGNPTGWRWDFGDGSAVSTEKDPSHTYRSARSYSVTLRISGPGGDASATKSRFIVAQVPIRTVPNVVGKTVAQAEAAITAAGLTVGNRERFPFLFGAQNKVIAQDPQANQRIPAGSRVNIKYF